MTYPTPRSEWLRPISERYLGQELGPAPATVWIAASLCAVNAAAAVGMTAIWGGMSLSLLRDQPGDFGGTLLVAGPVALIGAALAIGFGLSVIMVPLRGWSRIPFTAAVVLGLLALFGWWVSASAMRVMQVFTADEAAGGYRSAADEVAPWLVSAAIVAFALAVVLRLGGASSWLAKRRFQSRHAGPPEPDTGTGTGTTWR